MIQQSEPESRCAPELEQLSLEFIRMCEGLPLAIVALAGSLSKKEQVVSEWKKLLDNFSFGVESNLQLTGVSKVLEFSFLDLPYELKLCFLYFGIFPKDSLIPNDKLYKLWIAEGFVQEKSGKTFEEVAVEYLNELIHRNLVQACEGFYGLEKFCRVHSLMHEIARQKADEFSFCQIRDGHNSSFKGKSRRLLICNNAVENVLETIEDSQVRSVFIFNTGSQDTSSMATLQTGKFVPLEVLSLKNTKLRKLPKSVGKLHKLQTLDLRNTLVTQLPIEINQLQNLQHLLATCYDNNINLNSAQGVRINEGIGCLEKLQTLTTVEAKHSGIGLIVELEKLRQLRRLGISRLTAEAASALCHCIKEMSHLESLDLHSMNDNKLLNLQTISSPPPFLQRLVLKGLLQKFPDWISSLENLTMLCLSLSRLTDDPLNCVSGFPNLVSLWLYRAYEGEQLHFGKVGFQSLKLLVLREMHGLKVVEIEEGALPQLEELRIGPSPLLTEVPSGIQHLRKVKVLVVYDMSNEFVLSMQLGEGSDYWKVEHVPSILFWYRVEGRRYMLYKLGEPNLLDHLRGLFTSINDAKQRDLRLSFSYSGDKENSVSTSIAQCNGLSRLSLSSSSDRFSFISDDIED